MLDAVNLIHMNGRVYDPVLGRFLSADPIIQTLAISQAINAFSYVMNNPLSLIDPSGYSWLSSLFHSIGNFVKKWISVIVNVALLVAFPYMSPYLISFISSLAAAAVNGGTFGSFAIGFAAGVIGGKIGGPISGALTKSIGGQTLAATVLRGAISGAVAGGISSTIMGGSFMQGFAAGALGGAMGAAAAWGANALVAKLEAGHMTMKDQADISEKEWAKLQEDAMSDLRAKGSLSADDQVQFVDKYRLRAEGGLVTDQDTLSGAEIAQEAGYKMSAGETSPSGLFGFITKIFKGAFYSSVSPSGRLMSALETLEFTIMHEFWHQRGGWFGTSIGCFSGPSAEQCADNYAHKKLGY